MAKKTEVSVFSISILSGKWSEKQGNEADFKILSIIISILILGKYTNT